MIMTVFLSDLIAWSERQWPVAGAESWDAPGLVCGAPDHKVSRVLLTVDVTHDVVTEAVDGGFDLIIAHHPFLMRPVTTVAENTAKGAVISKAIRHGVAIYAAHTNADIVVEGVSDSLAKALGLQELSALSPAGLSVGHGRIGFLPEPQSLGDFARRVAKVLPSTAEGVKVAGSFDSVIKKVALCAGAGDSFIADAIASEADVYLTSDLRHHAAQDAREAAQAQSGTPALINVSHWAAEWVWLETASAQLSRDFSDIQFVVSHINTDPWDFVVTQ